MEASLQQLAWAIIEPRGIRLQRHRKGQFRDTESTGMR